VLTERQILLDVTLFGFFATAAIGGYFFQKSSSMALQIPIAIATGFICVALLVLFVGFALAE
jgi:hypothetical protein